MTYSKRRRSFLKKPLWLIPLAFLAACSFGSVIGVADLTEPRVVGLLTLNEEETRAYVGQRISGTQWDAQAEVVAINTATGAQTGSTPAWSGSWKTRAVASDPDNDHVWTMHANGAVVEWPVDLGSYLSWISGLFTAPSSTSLEMFCDMEILPNGHYVATGIASSGGNRKGFFTYVQPHPAFPGDWYRSHTYWDMATGTETIRQCPRVNYDEAAEEVTLLQPDTTYGSGGDLVSRYEVYSWDGGSPTLYYGLSYLGGFTVPASMKWIPQDIASAFGRTVVMFEYFNPGFASANGRMELYISQSGVYESTMLLQETRAVDMVNYAYTSSSTDALWWAGHDDASDKELGVVTMNIEPGDI